MEDQSTDASDLTETGETPGAEPEPVAAATPVGKRARHRSVRPRQVATSEPAASETSQAATTVEPEAELPAEAEPATEPKIKRRRWFRSRSAAPEEAVVAGDTDTTQASEDEPTVEFVERKPAGKRLTIAVAAAAALFVAAGAFAGAMLQPYLNDRVVAATKVNIVRAATDAITTLFTYTPDDMDQLPARSAKYLGGDLKDAYTKQVDALAATNKQNQVHRSAQVVGAAVESLNGADATAVVYANITYTSSATKDVPKLFLVSYRLNMQRKAGHWVIVNMPWITSKDLTRVTP